MATDITMPKLSDTMTEGRLISWKKGVGDKVERGDVIAEVETDKANMELEAFTSGYLLETRAKSGEMVPVGTVIGIIGEQGEKMSAAPGAVQQKEPHAPLPVAAMPKDEPAALPDKEELPSRQPQEPAGAGETPVPDIDLEEHKPAPLEEEEAGPERASPMVRRLAREHGIDLRRVSGSGPEGRIVLEDVEKLIERLERGEDEALEREKPVAVSGPTPGSAVPLSRMRRAIAGTVTESWRNAPHFAVTMPIDMAQAEKMYRSLKESGRKLSINDFVTKACALALAKFPLVNATFTEKEIVTHGDINIGIMVSLAEGLVVPVIRGCGSLSLLEIAERSKALVTRARSGKFSEDDLKGGTFSISNLGMFGVEEFTAVIYPPQGAILAVGAISDEAGVKKGQIVAQRIMRATISADHRLLDGAYAARFLGEIRRVLENPVVMLV